MTKRAVWLPLCLGLFLAALAWTSPTQGQGGPLEPPPNFCQGSIPWQVGPQPELPEADPCAGHPGTWAVDVQGDVQRFSSWAQAREDMITRGWAQGGTFWYEPGTPAGHSLFLPLMLSPLAPPLGFCQGGVPWQVAPHTLLPENSPCPASTGQFAVDVQGDVQRFNTWAEARADAHTRGWETGFTLFYEP